MRGAGDVKDEPTGETKREAKKVPTTGLWSDLLSYGFMAAASDTAPKEPGRSGPPRVLSPSPGCGQDIQACF